MSFPTLTPASSASAIVLPVTGTHADVESALSYGIYSATEMGGSDFLSGAVDQVAYTYKRLGGDVLDIEVTADNVYADYEMAVLEYSYIINTHQAKNVLGDLLGTTTGTFDHDGALKTGSLSSSLDGKAGVALRYPKFEFAYARRIGEGLAYEAGIGGTNTVYSASFATVTDQQDYDLQAILVTASDGGTDPATGDTPDFAGLIGSSTSNTKVNVRKVYYKTPSSMWRFYGYYGGLNVVGNMHSYGQWADDSTFEVVPSWMNKAQAMAFEDAIWTRSSHYSYELRNNKLRLFPTPNGVTADHMWFEFTIPTDPYLTGSTDVGIMGVNNMNTAPFENIPYKYINSIGKQWIRRFALALTMETLGQVRSKFGNTIPIPGESVNLNGSDLLSSAKEMQEKLRTELKELLDQLTYDKMAEMDKNMVESVNTIQKYIPMKIFVG
tara:strand:+ start:174 stop:1490 length:1317 start_codon:yes stop_codon:yes gene_type:complete